MPVIPQETSHELTENLLMLWAVGLSHLSPDALSRAQQLSISWWTLGLNYHELLLLTHSSLSFPKIPFLKQRWLQCICWNNLITMEGLIIDRLPSGRSASFPLIHYHMWKARSIWINVRYNRMLKARNTSCWADIAWWMSERLCCYGWDRVIQKASAFLIVLTWEKRFLLVTLQQVIHLILFESITNNIAIITPARDQVS